MWWVVVVGQPITNLISGPSFDFTFTIGPELDNIVKLRVLSNVLVNSCLTPGQVYETSREDLR